MGDYGDTCPIGGKQKGWSLLAGFGYNFAVDILSKLVQPGTGVDYFIKQEAETKKYLPSISKYQVVRFFAS